MLFSVFPLKIGLVLQFLHWENSSYCLYRNSQVSQSAPTIYQTTRNFTQEPISMFKKLSHANSSHSYQLLPLRWIILTSLKSCFPISLYLKIKPSHDPTSPSSHHISSLENISKDLLSSLQILLSSYRASIPFKPLK